MADCGYWELETLGQARAIVQTNIASRYVFVDEEHARGQVMRPSAGNIHATLCPASHLLFLKVSCARASPPRRGYPRCEHQLRQRQLRGSKLCRVSVLLGVAVGPSLQSGARSAKRPTGTPKRLCSLAGIRNEHPERAQEQSSGAQGSRAALGISRAALGISRAALGISRAALGIGRAALGIGRARPPGIDWRLQGHRVQGKPSRADWVDDQPPLSSSSLQRDV